MYFAHYKAYSAYEINPRNYSVYLHFNLPFT